MTDPEPTVMRSAKWLGKQKAVARDGSAGINGTVLQLQRVGTGAFDTSYVVAVSIGSNSQQFSLQVDTGSSDLWVTSSDCTSCSGSGSSYDPGSSSSSLSTGDQFDIQYLRGEASGPIYWDTVDVGGYSIDNQAFAAADTVTGEPLSLFSGVLGLALPLNSVIALKIPATTSNNPDGASITNNLFSIEPGAPLAEFLSLTLDRPGSTKIPSLLGIGKHPDVGTITLSDAMGGSQAQIGGKNVHYSKLLASTTQMDAGGGDLFWKIPVSGISVWVDGVERPVELVETFATSGEQPRRGLSAVLDSGVPIILTSQMVANGIYGALGIGPASDGNFYIPCSTPLNMTIAIQDHPQPYPLHPLDLTSPPDSISSDPDQCVGIIQGSDSSLSSVGISDMVLGVPFLRSVYFVMAYTVPDANGNFPHNNASTANNSQVIPDQSISPRLGLQSLLDPTDALDEFHRVRVLKQPIDNQPATAADPDGFDSHHKLSVGIIALIALGGFFGLCFILFFTRWLWARKKYGPVATASDSPHTPTASGFPADEVANKRSDSHKGLSTRVAGAIGLGGLLALGKKDSYSDREKSSRDDSMADYQLRTLQNSSSRTSRDHAANPSEDELRAARFNLYLQKKEKDLAALENPLLPLTPTTTRTFTGGSESPERGKKAGRDTRTDATMSSSRTRVNGGSGDYGDEGYFGDKGRDALSTVLSGDTEEESKSASRNTDATAPLGSIFPSTATVENTVPTTPVPAPLSHVPRSPSLPSGARPPSIPSMPNVITTLSSVSSRAETREGSSPSPVTRNPYDNLIHSTTATSDISSAQPASPSTTPMDGPYPSLPQNRRSRNPYSDLPPLFPPIDHRNSLPVNEFGMREGSDKSGEDIGPGTMAGIGTAARSRLVSRPDSGVALRPITTPEQR